jgi:WD40 repeat protein
MMLKIYGRVAILACSLLLLWSILPFDASVTDTQSTIVSIQAISEQPDVTPLSRSNVQQLGLERVLGHGSADVIAWSPHGEQFAIGGSRGIWLYDRANLASEPQVLVDDRGWVQELRFNADGRLLLSVDRDRNISLWDVENGIVIDRFGLTGDQFGIMAIGFTPSGRVVVATSNGRYVALRDFHTGYPIWVRRGNAGNVRRLRFSQNGQYLISEGEAPDTVIWDVESATSIARYETQSGVLMTQDGRLLAPEVAGIRGNRPIFYSADDGIVRRIFPLVGVDGFPVIDYAMRYIVYHDPTAATAVLIDVETEQETMRFSTADVVVETLQFSPNGRWLGVAHDHGDIHVWDMQTGLSRQMVGHEQAVLSMAFDPESQALVSASKDGIVRVWDMPTMTTIAQFQYTMALVAATLSPDGNHILATGGTGQVSLEESEFNQIWVWNRASGELETVAQHYPDRITSLEFHPMGERLAIGTLDGTVEMVLVDGLVPTTIRDDFILVADIAFHPSGESLAIGGVGVEIWSLDATDPAHDLQTLITPLVVNAVAFNSDGTLLAAAYANTVTVWQSERTGQYEELYVLNHHRGEVNTVAFQPDGSLLATGSIDGTVRLWDMNSGEEVQRLRGDFEPIIPTVMYDVIFSPDGTLVIAGAGGHRQSEDAIWIWDVETGDLVATLKGHFGGVYGIDISADGATLISASWDGTVGVWRIIPE